MIELAGSDPSDEWILEFDEYVPVTATGPGYDLLTSPPTYVRALDEHRLLELKFDPAGGELVELVLVNTPGARIVEKPFPSPVGEALVTARWTGGQEGGEFTHLDVTYYQDCALMTLSADPISEWRGHGKMFFGIHEHGAIGAIGVRWGDARHLTDPRSSPS